MFCLAAQQGLKLALAKKLVSIFLATSMSLLPVADLSASVFQTPVSFRRPSYHTKHMSLVFTAESQRSQFDHESSDSEETDDMRARIWHQFGVSSRLLENSRIEYYLKIGTRETPVLKCSTDKESERAVLEFLSAKLETLKSRIKEHYGIDLEVRPDWVSYSSVSSTDSSFRLRLRNPNMQEIYCLNYALEHSQPSQFVDIGMKRALSVYFLMDSNVAGTLGQWGLDQRRKPAIFIEPASSKMLPLETTLLHEFGHNSAYRLGWRPENALSWKLISRLGWKSYYNANQKECGYLILTDDGSTIQKLYKFSQTQQKWLRSDKDGRPLDYSGRICRLKEAEKISTNQLRQIALIRPVSSYCPDPMEVFAEAISFYRSSRENRSRLMACSLALYEIIQEHDNLEIERSFGKGKMIRMPGGALACQCEKHLEELAEFESTLRRAERTAARNSPMIFSQGAELSCAHKKVDHSYLDR